MQPCEGRQRRWSWNEVTGLEAIVAASTHQLFLERVGKNGVKHPLAPCPRCETHQPFPRRKRKTKVKDVFEVYLSCTVCPYEEVIEYVTPKLERVLKRKRQVRQKVEKQPSLERVLKALMQEEVQERQRLRELMRNA